MTGAKRILLTGATGFLGGRTATRLRELGHEVTGVGRNRAAGSRLETSGVRFVELDIGDAGALKALAREHTHVVHCAALSSAWGPPAEFERANVVGTRNVALACEAAGIERLVHVSSPSIYVDTRDRVLVREDEPLPERPINDYAATKRRAEAEVDRAHARGLDAVTIRPQAIIGPGDPAIFPRLLRVAKRGVFPMIGAGDNVVDVTYVDNVAHAIALCLDAPSGVSGRKYNITNGEPTAFYGLLERVFSMLELRTKTRRIPFLVAYASAGMLERVHLAAFPAREPLLTRYSVCVLGKTRTLDIRAARRDLGYEPAISVAEGIERFVRWWKEREHES